MAGMHPRYGWTKLTLTLALAALALGMQATAAAAQSGDVVFGAGDTDVGSRSHFDFTVEGSATGANPTGHFSLTGPPTFYTWEATPRCMNAAGDRATLGFFIDSGSIGGRDISGQAVLLWIQRWDGAGTVYYKILGRDVPGDPNPITCADPRLGPDPSFSAIGAFGDTFVNDVLRPIPPGSDSVTGGADSGCIIQGVADPCILRLFFDAGVMSGPNGENPTGAVRLFESGPTPGGTTDSAMAVTCLSVSGQVAIIGVTGGRQRFGSSMTHTQIAGLIRVLDAGGPDSGADTFQFALQEGPRNGPPLPGPTSCSSFPGPFPDSGPFRDFTNTFGNVVVTDSRSLPTSKDQCKKGGWQSYGVFRNQGDCVSFVATGGENPPRGKTS